MLGVAIVGLTILKRDENVFGDFPLALIVTVTRQNPELCVVRLSEFLLQAPATLHVFVPIKVVRNNEGNVMVVLGKSVCFCQEVSVPANTSERGEPTTRMNIKNVQIALTLG